MSRFYPNFLYQEILIERHGPQSKKSRKKSVDEGNDVVVMSSSEGSDCEGIFVKFMFVAFM